MLYGITYFVLCSELIFAMDKIWLIISSDFYLVTSVSLSEDMNRFQGLYSIDAQSRFLNCE
jgi:hypothetical protein